MVIELDNQADDAFDVRRAYDDHCGEIFGFAFNALRERTAAEDCVQETFLRTRRSRTRFDSSKGSAHTWLFAIARNAVVDSVRARARRQIPVEDTQLGSRAGVTEAEDSRIMDRLVLYEAMASLSLVHREVVAAIQLDGLSYLQLSERTGVSVMTLRTRMFHALKDLRKLLGEEF